MELVSYTKIPKKVIVLDSSLSPPKSEISASTNKVITVHGTFGGGNDSDIPLGPIGDSGAEEHMRRSSELLKNVRPLDKRDPTFVNANGENMNVTHVGTAPEYPDGANTVYVCPSLHRDLVAVGQLENLGDGGQCVRIIDDPDNKRRQRWVVHGKTVLTTILNKETNLLDVVVDDEVSRDWYELVQEKLAAKATKLWTSVERPRTQQLVQLLHVALNHAALERMVEVVEKGFMQNLPHELTVRAIRKYFPSACVACLKGRAAKEPSAADATAMAAAPKPRPSRKERAAIRLQKQQDAELDEVDDDFFDEEEEEDDEPGPLRQSAAVAAVGAIELEQAKLERLQSHWYREADKLIASNKANVACSDEGGCDKHDTSPSQPQTRRDGRSWTHGCGNIKTFAARDPAPQTISLTAPNFFEALENVACSDEGECDKHDTPKLAAPMTTRHGTKQVEPVQPAKRPNSKQLERDSNKALDAAIHSNQKGPAVAAPKVPAVSAKQVQKPNSAKVPPAQAIREGQLEEQIQNGLAADLDQTGSGSVFTEPPDDILSCDIGMPAGDERDAAFDGSTHVVTFRTRHCGFIHIAFLNTLEHLEDVVNEALEQYTARGRRVVTLRVDNQFVTAEVQKTLDQYGVKAAACAPHEHNQNGQGENTVGLVAREARVLLHGAHPEYPRNRWPKAYKAAVLALNISLPSRTDPTISCYQDWHRTKLDFHQMALLPFGCKVYGHEETKTLAKLDSRVFAGFFELPSEIHHQVVSIYDPETKACKLRRSYWVTDSPLNRIIEGVEVDMIKEIKEPEVKSNTALNSRKAFLKARLQALRVTATKDSTCHFCKKRWTTHTDQYGWTAWYQCEYDNCAIWACEKCQPKMEMHENEHRLKGDPLAPPPAPPTVPKKKGKGNGKGKSKRQAPKRIASVAVVPLTTHHVISVPDTESGETRYYRIEQDSWHVDARINRPSALICAVARNPLDATPLDEETLPCTDKPEFEEPALDKYLAQWIKDPSGYKTMLKHPHSHEFKAAASAELQNVKDNQTWVEVQRSDIPAGTRIHDSMFVFKTKRDSDGRFLKFKARLTFRGDQQDDVGDTWAPTIHAETWRFLLAVGARLDLEMSQMDIAGAFLKEHMPADMDDMYMRLPVAHTGDPIFVRLLRSLYGLREAPRIFHLGLRKHLLKLGFRTSMFDTCLFSKKNADGSTVWAAIHVDDIFVFASSTAARDAFRAGMEARYELSWQDEASSFLNFTISRDRSRLALTISQPGYARHVVKMAGLENAPIASSPGEHLRPFTGTSRGAGDPTRMRSLVGLMQYLTNSRPDIICELNKAAKTMSAPTAEDITAAERIIRYINSTLDHGITFSGDGPCQIVGYADASNQSETGGYSRTSIILSLGEGNGAFVAKSYTQTLLGTSTQHSEIQALSDATRYAVYFRNIAAELGLHQEPIPMFEDNRAAESFTKGESEFDRSKHILQQHRYCAEAQGLKFISVLPIDTKLQRADQGTKILPPLEHAFHTALNLNLANRVPVPALAAGQ